MARDMAAGGAAGFFIGICAIPAAIYAACFVLIHGLPLLTAALGFLTGGA